MWRLIRRVGFALGAAGLLSTIFRVKGEGEVPAQVGGWRPVGSDEFR